jgi:PrcB C-terminal
MKKNFIIVLLILSVILIPGCAGKINKEKTDNTNKPVSAEPQKGGDNKGITVNKLEVVYVEKDKAEELLGSKYTSINKLKGYKLINANNETYLYIGLGEKSTGGYDLQVVGLEDNEGILNVQVKVIQPGPEDIVTQVITYPHKVLKINFMPREVNIKSINTGETFQEVIPEGVSE